MSNTAFMSTREKRYFRNVATVLSGTVAAQSIPLLAMLLITRLITPEALGVFSVWLSFVFLASILATARLEILLVVLPSSAEKLTCLRIASAVSIAASFLAAAAALGLNMVFSAAFPAWTPAASLALGLAIWALAMNTIWLSCAVSVGAFGTVNGIRLTSASLTAGAQILGAMASFSHYGLMWGYVLGNIAGALYGRYKVAAMLRSATGPVRQEDKAVDFLRRHYRTPLYALPASLLSTASQQMPIILSGALFGAHAAGLVALTLRTISAPVSVFSESVQDVYKNQATEDYLRDGNCRAAYLQSLKLLMAIAAAPCLILLLAGPALFSFVYGPEWREAGVMAQVLVPMLFLRFFASPLGYTFFIAQKAHLELLWQIALLMMTLAVFVSAVGVIETLAWYSAGYSCLYIVYLYLSYQTASGVGATPHAEASPDGR